jgi:hypothetical protein
MGRAISREAFDAPDGVPADSIRVRDGEIEPGRPVRNDWDKELFEPWADRKARRAGQATS